MIEEAQNWDTYPAHDKQKQDIGPLNGGLQGSLDLFLGSDHGRDLIDRRKELRRTCQDQLRAVRGRDDACLGTVAASSTDHGEGEKDSVGYEVEFLWEDDRHLDAILMMSRFKIHEDESIKTQDLQATVASEIR